MKKKKAFTLTELLVVVVIIGVLSAVVLPKFTKVIETRKTTEAEEVMAAVRTEQEARCALDKSYTSTAGQLASLPGETGKNFSYTLGSVGISAQRTGKDYTLEIPSYADGRICCSGTGCSELNKDYPLCSDLTNKSKTPDYVEAKADCSAEEVPPPPEPVVHECTNKSEHTAGTTTSTDSEGCTVSTTWSFTDYPTCQWNKTESKNCPEPVVHECTNKSEHTAGTTTSTDSEGCTVSTTWSFTDYPTCQWNKTESKNCPEPERTACTEPWTTEEKASCACDIKGPDKQPCTNGAAGQETRSVTCNPATGLFAYGAWDKSACNISKENCVWTKGDLVTCRMSWELYCSLAGTDPSTGMILFLNYDEKCQGTYYGQVGVCEEKPTSPTDTCMSYEGHIVPPACASSGEHPSGKVNWGVARRYTAQCTLSKL